MYSQNDAWESKSFEERVKDLSDFSNEILEQELKKREWINPKKYRCKWIVTIEQIYKTSCKHSFFFIEGILKDNPDFKHCPYCGKEIVEK